MLIAAYHLKKEKKVTIVVPSKLLAGQYREDLHLYIEEKGVDVKVISDVKQEYSPTDVYICDEFDYILEC